MRLFIAVRPPEAVLDQVASLVTRLQGSVSAGSRQALRWTSRDQWHVTLRFLGEVDEPAPVIAALDVADVGSTEARLGPSIQWLGRYVLCLPVAGLDDLAAGVIAATAGLGQPPEERPFVGHLTLARVRRRPGRDRAVRRDDLQGRELDVRWAVAEVALVRSHPRPDGPRYEDLHVRALGDRPPA